MRILHIVKKFPNMLGGDAIFVKHIKETQEKMGNEVNVLVSNCDEVINSPSIYKFGLKDSSQNYDKITLKRLISLIYLFFFAFYFLRKLKPTIVHSHSADLGFFVSFACRLYKIPIVDTVHGFTFPDNQHSFIKRKAELFFLKNSSFNYIMSVDGNGEKIFTDYRISNFKYIPNGIKIKDFKHEKCVNDKITILTVGRLERQKGLNYLLTAISELYKVRKDFILNIIGDGSERNHLEELIYANNLSKNVFLLGKVDNNEISKNYLASDIFVLTSIWEGFPLSIFEAWAAALPIIVTDVGGVSLICNKNNSIVIPPRDIQAIVNSLIDLIDNKEKRFKLGNNGYELVKNTYTWEIIWNQLESVYKSAINSI